MRFDFQDYVADLLMWLQFLISCSLCGADLVFKLQYGFMLFDF